MFDIVLILFYLLFTNDRQRATKFRCKRDESTTKIVNIPRISSSLEKASSRVLLELVCRRTLDFTITYQAKQKLKQIYIWNTMTTGFIM